MIRIEVYRHTGPHAANVKIAARVARKIQNAISVGHTVLIDYDRVLSVEPMFATTLLPVIDESKVKVIGMSPRSRS